MLQSKCRQGKFQGGEKDRSIQSKRWQDKFQDQAVYQENLHLFMSTEATERPKSLEATHAN